MPDTGTFVFSTFGDLLKYLRRRAQLTQRELAIAVGYTEGHISRLEKNQRLPDLATVAALFVPALMLEEEPEVAAHLIQLAAGAHGETLQAGIDLSFSHTQETQEISERLESIPSNLPIQLTTFIGRQKEIRELTELLSGRSPSRLITLTAPGGMGKTRLALQTAIGLSHHYRDGVWFVDLAPLSSPEFLPQTVASVLDIPEKGGQAIDQVIIESLRTMHLLIVLDNCEHLVQAAAQFVENVLRACAHVQILATSRELLQVPGEVNFRVPPLSMPADTELETQASMRHEALQLFFERARTIEPTFALTDANSLILARICRQLDGMPLAIELAVARIRILSLNQIEARLKNRFQLLTGGQTRLPRHQTLRATLEWSYDMLSEGEKALFRRCSVFAGGWTLEAANSVCEDRGSDVLDTLAQLVNKSLIVVERPPDGEVRYTMLETIREFAREQLGASGEMETLRARHFEYFLRMTQQGEDHLFAAESTIDWAETEISNLRMALAWSLEDEGNGLSQERAGRGLELMTHVWPLWLNRGYSTEGNAWMKQLLTAHTVPTAARARALTLFADFARYRGDYNAELASIEESLALAQRLGNKKLIAWALMEMGLAQRDLRRYSEAIPFLSDSLEIFRKLGENLWTYRTSFWLAEVHMVNRDLEAAKLLWERGLELCREDNDQWQIAWGLEGSGHVARLEGRLQNARELYIESLHLKATVMDKAGIAYALEAFAQLAAAEGYFERAARLWGAADQLRTSLNLLHLPSREELYTSWVSTTRTQLGEAAFAEAQAWGQAMNMQEAIQYALTQPDG